MADEGKRPAQAAGPSLERLFRETRGYLPGTALVSEGQEVTHVLRLVSGAARVSKRQGDEEKPVADLGPGEWVGEIAALTGAPASATVRALTSCQALAAPREEVARALEEDPQLASALGRTVAARLRATQERRLFRQGTFLPIFCSPAAHDEARWLALGLARGLAFHARGSVALVDLDADRSPLQGLHQQPGLAALAAASDAGSAAPAGVRVVPARLGSAADLHEIEGALLRLLVSHDQVVAAVPLAGGQPLERALARARLLLALAAGDPQGGAIAAARAAAGPSVDRVRVVTGDGSPVATEGELRRVRAEHQGLQAAVIADLAASTARRAPLDAAENPAARSLARLSRACAGLSVGLALGSGSTKGFAHVGALEGLEELGVPIDCIAGTSIGAVCGGLYALGRRPEQILDVLARTRRHAVRVTLPFRSLLSNRGLAEHARQGSGGHHFADTTTPFAAVAVDFFEGSEVVFREGPLWRAVLASSSIPGIYPPVEVDGHLCCDGGVLSPVPVRAARALGADVVVAVRLDSPIAYRERARRRPSLAAQFLRAIELMQERINQGSAAPAEVLLAPQLGESHGVLKDFAYAEEFRAAGRAAALGAREQLKARLPWLG